MGMKVGVQAEGSNVKPQSRVVDGLKASKE